MVGRSALLGHAEPAVGRGRQRIGRWMRGCSCLGGLLRGLLGALARMWVAEMGFVEFRWRRMSVEIWGTG